MNNNNRSDIGHTRGWALLALFALVCVPSWVLAQRTAADALPQEVVQLLEAQPLDQIVLDPTRRRALLVHERKLLPIERLAEPAIELIGRSINPATAAPHAPRDYYGITLIDLLTREETPIVLPRGAVIGYPQWAADGSRFAFTLTRSSGTELWIGEPAEGRARMLVQSINGWRGRGCAWAPDNRRLLCRRVVGWRDSRRNFEPDAFAAAAARQSLLGRPIMIDASLARSLLESQLEIVDSVSGQRFEIGRPTAFEDVIPSPAGAFLLITRILEPYPTVSGAGPVYRVVEVWDRFGNVVKRLPAGARAAGWHPAQPATLIWVERRDRQDHIVLLPPPYSDTSREVFTAPHSFSGLRWIGSSGALLISDYDADRQRTDLWHTHVDDIGTAPELISSFGSIAAWTPVTTINERGSEIVLERDNGFYVRGHTRTNDASATYLAHISLRDGRAERIWESAATAHETVIDILTADASVLLIRHETATSPPNYRIVDSRSGSALHALTRNEHPVPRLKDSPRLRLEYRRADGLELAASLYLPPEYDGQTPLPAVVWAYPRRVADGTSADGLDSRARFMTFDRAFRLFFLLRGYAVLDDVAMPIVGNQADANDTFIEQIVANAEAAVAAAQATGFVDADRIGIAGHSYGAFMVANLLAHARMFSAGIALSGAYNRTLTPFGFQTERRTLWEAPETYLAMSPLLYSHQIEAPLLLVHGLLDDNAGTSPLQSTQFYEAIRGNAGKTELLLLPWEGHSYRARESVLRTASEMLDWFDRHVKNRLLDSEKRETGAFARPSQ